MRQAQVRVVRMVVVHQRRLSAFKLLLALAMLTALASPCRAEWTAAVDPPGQLVVWPEKLQLGMPQPSQFDELLFSHTDSRFCLGGLGAYDSSQAVLVDLTTGKVVGGIKGKPANAIRRALSPDGQYLAQVVLQNGNHSQVEIWSLSTGQMTASFAADDPAFSLTILDFAGVDEVLTHTIGSDAGKSRQTVRIWSAKSGEKLREFAPGKLLQQDSYGLSPGGRYLAAVALPEVAVFDLQSGQRVGAIQPPEKSSEGKYVSISAVRFSPDGKEIAVISTGQSADVVSVYDAATGEEKALLDVPPSAKSAAKYAASYKGPKLEFITEPRGFLLFGGVLIDRETGLHLWTYQQGTLEFAHWRRILTPAGLITSAGEHGKRKVIVVPFPAETIQRSVEAYRKGGPAVVTAGSSVKLDVKVGAVRFQKPEEAKAAIETALAERLAADGIAVSAEGTTVLAVQYQEAAGKVLQEVKGGTVFGGGTPTGRSVQSTAGDVKISWTSTDKKTKLFEQNVTLDPSYLRISGATELTDEKARGQVFEILKLQLAELPLPYFVPSDKSLSVLPVPTISPAAAAKGDSPQDVINRRIEARKKALNR